MIENADQQLSELGAVPEDLRAIVTRTLGDRPITPALADELLDALAAGRHFELPSASAFADAAAVISSISAPPPALDSVAPPPPVLDSVAPPPPALDSFAPPPPALDSFAPPPPALDSFAPPSPSELSRPAPMPWDSLPAPNVASAPAPAAVFAPAPASVAAPAPAPLAPPPAAAPMPWDSEPAPQPVAAPEVTAESIVAAFDAPEPAPADPDTLQSSPAPALKLPPAPNLELKARPARRGEWSGSRRPDLDKLLDQPLDALDFERSEQTDVVQTELPQPAAVAPAEAAPVASPAPPASSGDDFEILVDDEILEIAEDDVELMDDENS